MSARPRKNVPGQGAREVQAPYRCEPPAGAFREQSAAPLAESTLTSKGQVTIPAIIRSRYHLDAGDVLVWRMGDDGRLVVEAKRSFSLAHIRAAVAAAGAPVPARAFTDREMDEAIAQEIEARFGRP